MSSRAYFLVMSVMNLRSRNSLISAPLAKQPLEVFQRDTREILRRFIAGEIEIAQCALALNAAFADVFPSAMRDNYLDALRLALMANDDVLTHELKRRAGEAGLPGSSGILPAE